MKKFLFALCMISLVSYAGTEGGGGDVVVLPDGKVVLADVFLDRGAPQPNNMPKEISLNPKLLWQIKTYTEFLKQLLESKAYLGEKRSDIIELLTNLGNVPNDLAFYVVQDAAELNDFCASGGRKVYRLEEGHKVEQVACTSGSETYLVGPLFKRMGLIQQALLLFHERLTTFRDRHGGKNYQAIAGFTSGLYRILEITYEQQNGNFRALNEDDISRIRIFYESVFELEYRSIEVPIDGLSWQIHPIGGGLIKGNSKVSPDAFIGITSFVDGAEVGSRSFVHETYITKNSIIGEDVILSKVGVVKRGKEQPFYIVDDGTQIKNTHFEIVDRITVGKNSKIIDSKIQATTFEVGDNILIEKSEINLLPPEGYSPIPLPSYKVVLKSNQTLVDGLIDTNSQENYAPVGSRILMGPISVTESTECQTIENMSFRFCFKIYHKGETIHMSEDEFAQNVGSTVQVKYNEEKIEIQKNRRDLKLVKGDTVVLLKNITYIYNVLPLDAPGDAKNLSLIYQNEIRKVGPYLLREYNPNTYHLVPELESKGAVFVKKDGYSFIRLPILSGAEK